MAVLKRSLEEEATTHEAALTEQRHKHSQELQQLNEQHEQLKKAKAGKSMLSILTFTETHLVNAATLYKEVCIAVIVMQ